MTESFVELKDELHVRKAQLNFFLNAFAAMAADLSREDAWPDGWEVCQGVQMAQEVLKKMVERIDEALKPYLRQPR